MNLSLLRHHLLQNTGAFLLCCSTISCSTSPVTHRIIDGHPFTVCDVVKVNTSHVEYLQLSELVDSLEVIRLETNEHSLIKRIQKVSISEHYLGILDSDGPRVYKLFDKKGRFINQIGDVGNGPLEYFILNDAQVDESEEQVYLAGFFHVNELLVFDFNGRSIESIPLVYTHLDKPKFFISHDTITCFQMPHGNTSAFVFRQDMQGHVIDSIPATEQMYAQNYDEELFVRDVSGAKSLYYTVTDTLFRYNPHQNFFCNTCLPWG